MLCLVTGCAGFIGSHLAERLLAEGHNVIGVDCFTNYYARSIKERNLAGFRDHGRFQFLEMDLAEADACAFPSGLEYVFHLAAMPGLTRSWVDVDTYTRCNLTATHRLLEQLKGEKQLRKVIYASTSSVYGKYASGDESLPTRPSSPYGITKLAGEQLVRVYQEEFGIPGVVLRYFSVYGPRQRPEMGIHLFINSVLQGKPITLTGDGLQVRGNTYIADCIEATVRAAWQALPGETFNLGGGEICTVLEMIRKIERCVGRPAVIERHPPRKGDQLATGADVSKLYRHLGWRPSTTLDEGVAQQVAWQRTIL